MELRVALPHLLPPLPLIDHMPVTPAFTIVGVVAPPSPGPLPQQLNHPLVGIPTTTRGHHQTNLLTCRVSPVGLESPSGNIHRQIDEVVNRLRPWHPHVHFPTQAHIHYYKFKISLFIYTCCGGPQFPGSRHMWHISKKQCVKRGEFWNGWTKLGV